jgi:acetolactate synthase-1/2/3 large subunit
MTEPRGPVYLMLPREVLANPAAPMRRSTVRPLGAATPEPARAAIEEAAALIAKAEFPLIVTSSVGRDPEAVEALAALAQEHTIPVVQSEARDYNLPTRHLMNLGFEPASWLGKADVIVVLDSVVPWIPKTDGPRKDAKVIHISNDPLATRYPFREIEADLLITGSPCVALRLLRECLAGAPKAKNGAADTRRKTRLRATHGGEAEKLIETAKDQTPVHPAFLPTVSPGEDRGACVISASACRCPSRSEQAAHLYGRAALRRLGFRARRRPRRWARRARARVIVTVGDGLCMLAIRAPTRRRAGNLATLTIITNNTMWAPCASHTRRRTLTAVPPGNVMPLTELKPSPDFEKVIEACGGHGEKVEGPAAVMPALERSLAAVRSGTPATLNIMTQGRR